MKKILIIKIGAIGDVIMASTMIHAAKEKYGPCHITWMGGTAVIPLLKSFEGIDEIIEVDDKNLLTGILIQKISALLKVWSLMFGKKYDLVCNGHADGRYKLLELTLSGGEYRRFQRNPQFRIIPVPGRHHSDEYALLITGEIVPSDKIYPLAICKTGLLLTENLLPTGKNIIALSPGGAKNTMRDDNLRRWPVESFVLVAKSLMEKGHEIVLIGSNSDKWVEPYFSGLPVVNLIGKVPLESLCEIYKKCALIITHDSGPLHFTGLARRPVIALFGPTNPYEKVPRHPLNKILWGGENLTCRPCYDGRTYGPCDNNICIKSVTVAQVVQSAVDILQTINKRAYFSQ